MYKQPIFPKTTISRSIVTEGETIEQKLSRIKNNKEPITDGAAMIYTEGSEGVKAEYNIRTDKFEEALKATDKTSRNAAARRKEMLAELKEKQEGTTKETSSTEPKSGDPSQ